MANDLEPRAGSCPVKRNVDLVTLSKAPFSVVETAFKGFHTPQQRGLARGGFVVEKDTYLDKCPGIAAYSAFSPDYRREQSFNAEQGRFVQAALMTLEYLAIGQSAEGKAITSPSYSRIILKNMEQFKWRNYRALIYGSNIDLLNIWAHHYDNLLPAMRAGFQVAGISGMSEVANDSDHALYDAGVEVLHSKNIDSYTRGLNVHSTFLKGHAAVEVVNAEGHPIAVKGDRALQREILCPGERLAGVLIREARIAAVILVENPLLVEELKSMIHFTDPDISKSQKEFDSQISNIIETHSRRAQLR